MGAVSRSLSAGGDGEGRWAVPGERGLGTPGLRGQGGCQRAAWGQLGAHDGKELQERSGEPSEKPHRTGAVRPRVSRSGFAQSSSSSGGPEIV